jgi:hypothetical protein
MSIPGNSVQVLSPFQERLASLPDVTRRTTTGDGTEPKGPSTPTIAGQPQAASAGQTADDRVASQIAPPPGKTLQDPAVTPAIKFTTVEQLVRSQDALARNRYAIDTHFRRIRAGVPFSRLEKIPNQSLWTQKLPTGMTKESSASVPNKADDLCNKIEDTLMADPPKPDPQPHVSDEAAKEAAELASEFLLTNGGEAGTNDTQTYRWALNNALTAASSFLHYVVDRSGGGYQPLQKLAHPLAQDPANPLVALVPAQGAMGEPIQVEERATDPIMRYVSAPTPQAPAGSFVADAAQADRVWLPAITIERYRRESVRLFPATATVETCVALVLIRFCNLSDARTAWPETVAGMSQEELFALANWRPVQAEQVVPFALRGALQTGGTGPALEEVGSLSPQLQRRMFSYRLYIKACPEYPQGYWCDVSGANGGMVLAEGTLDYTVQLPTAGKSTRCRDIPVTQTRPQQDVDGGDSTGFPLIARFAGPSEAEQTLYAAFQDMCDNMLHPHVFVPSTQAIDDDDWLDRTRPIVYDPTGGGVPTYEQFPPLPPVLPLIENMDQKMDTISGLTQTAQGLDSPGAVSGVAKNLTIRQALVALSGIQQNLHSAMTRGWRICCQLAQAEFSTPQLMSYAGEAGSSQPRWWTGEDLAGIDRVGIQPGTGTMMTPEAKANYVAFLQEQNWMTVEEAATVALPGIKMDLGIPENPYEAAIEREVGVWLQGPTPSWLQASQQQQRAKQAAEQAYQQQTAGMDPALVPPFQPPPMTPLPQPFMPRPNDSEIAVATIYAKRLSKLFVNPQFAAQPSAWQQVAADAYGRYMQALQPPPVIPKGVVIQAKAGDAASLAADEAAAASGKAPPPQPGGPTPTKPPTAPHLPSAGLPLGQAA